MKKLLFLIMAFGVFSCKKENVCESENKTTYIQIEAVYIDGDYDLSEIVVVR